MIHKFYWVLDKKTLIEHIQSTDELDKLLSPPTKLNITSFYSIVQMTPDPATEIDIVGVVLRCGPSKYAGRSQNRCCEVTFFDDLQNQFLLTLWGDIGEIEGTELDAKMKKDKKFPVILGRNIGISPYQGLSLQIIFNFTIRINPTYPQAFELISWEKTNKVMLSGHASSNFAGSSTALIMNIVHERVIPIAELTSTTSAGVFYIEA